MITKEEAIRLSKLKWQHIVEHGGSDYDLYNDHPELTKLVGGCGLCQYHRCGDNNNLCDAVGEDCGVAKLGDYCYRPGSAYHAWIISKTREAAQRMLDIINQIRE